jgi:hypothetical protein
MIYSYIRIRSRIMQRLLKEYFYRTGNNMAAARILYSVNYQADCKCCAECLHSLPWSEFVGMETCIVLMNEMIRVRT